MSQQYAISCDCGTVELQLNGEPRVRGYCHCNDCRDLLKIPYHSVTAWEPEQVDIISGADSLIEFQHPTKRMKRVYCGQCGETLFNTNTGARKLPLRCPYHKANGARTVVT